jgi:hypothetical protein
MSTAATSKHARSAMPALTFTAGDARSRGIRQRCDALPVPGSPRRRWLDLSERQGFPWRHFAGQVATERAIHPVPDPPL